MTTLEKHLTRQAERSQNFFWNRLRWDLVCDRLPKTDSAVLVDVGAGPGFLGDFLRVHQPNIDYRFIEPLAGLERELEGRFGVEANIREAETFGSARFVTLLDVLEHQEDDRGFLRELADKMEPGAILLLTVPAMPSLWSNWDVSLGHFRRYGKDTLLAAAAGLPFDITQLDYIFPELIPLGWFRKLRMRSSPENEVGSEVSAEFPDLPRWLDETLYRVGRGTMRFRRHWPAGTSLFAVLRRTA